MWTQRTPDGILNCFVSPDATETFIESCDGRIVGRYLLAMSSRRRPRRASWREGPLRLGRSSPLIDVHCAARSCTRLNGDSQAVSPLSRTVYAPTIVYCVDVHTRSAFYSMFPVPRFMFLTLCSIWQLYIQCSMFYDTHIYCRIFCVFCFASRHLVPRRFVTCSASGARHCFECYYYIYTYWTILYMS